MYTVLYLSTTQVIEVALQKCLQTQSLPSFSYGVCYPSH